MPTRVFVVFWFGAVCAIVTVGLAMPRTKEVAVRRRTGAPAVAVEGDHRHGPRGRRSREGDAIDMHTIGLAFLFQWYAMFIYWQFVSVSVTESVWNAAPDTPAVRRRPAGSG